MAVFVPGTPCPLCGKPMAAPSEVIMFRPFVADRWNPLFVFSDTTLHTSCFARHPLSEEATKWHDEAAHRSKANERVCEVCSKPVLDPDDYFGTGLLTHDPANPLYEINFVHLHRSHAGSWERLGELRRRMEKAHASGAWQGPRLVFGTTPLETVRRIV